MGASRGHASISIIRICIFLLLDHRAHPKSEFQVDHVLFLIVDHERIEIQILAEQFLQVIELVHMLDSSIHGFALLEESLCIPVT